MFTVIGSYQDVAYKVTVGDDGAVTGSAAVVGALQAAAGQQVAATPTGPVYDVRAGDPVSAWAWLATQTRVVETGGDLPEIVPPRRLGAVY